MHVQIDSHAERGLVDITMSNTCPEGNKHLHLIRLENDEVQDSHRLSPTAVYSYLGRVMYNRRSKMNPLWSELVIAGFDNGKPYVLTAYGAFTISFPRVNN
jgi:20S proteasome alpha/beta subunit